jgi:L-threonylcarbamoyladenylate synthase
MRTVLDRLAGFTGDPAVGIAAPSANRFGRVSPTTVGHVEVELGLILGPDDVILDGGPSSVGVESTIVDCTGPLPVILRPGHVSADDVTAATGLALGETSSVRAPGTLASHYAPQARVTLVDAATLESTPGDDAMTGVLALAGIPTPVGLVRLREPHTVAEYAQVLYAALRDADSLGLARVLAVPPSADGVGAAVIDRLQRAAAPG